MSDVASYPVDHLRGRFRGLIASPPCQALSMAGKRKGVDELSALHSAVEACRHGWVEPKRDWLDPRSPLILQPLRWAAALRPEWVACEQVPKALGIWEHMVDVLRGWGYYGAAANLNAADYGVPQTRIRAFLVAHVDRERARFPEPTHAEQPTTDFFGATKLPWVTMAAALGWGLTGAPAGTVVGGSSQGGAANSLDGGTGARNKYRTAIENGEWIQRRPATTIVGTFGYGGEPVRHATQRWQRD